MLRDDYSMTRVQDLHYDELTRGIQELAQTVEIPTHP